jgi:hypothetical protein
VVEHLRVSHHVGFFAFSRRKNAMRFTLVDEPVRNTSDPDTGERGPIQPEREPSNEAGPPDADKPPRRREGVVSNPDF